MAREIPKVWQRYLEMAGEGKVDESIAYLSGQGTQWRTHREAADSISAFLMKATREQEVISLEIIPPEFIHAMTLFGLQAEELPNDSDQLRDRLIYAKRRLEANARNNYPAPNGRNDDAMNISGSLGMMRNAFRDKKGRDYNRY